MNPVGSSSSISLIQRCSCFSVGNTFRDLRYFRDRIILGYSFGWYACMIYACMYIQYISLFQRCSCLSVGETFRGMHDFHWPSYFVTVCKLLRIFFWKRQLWFTYEHAITNHTRCYAVFFRCADELSFLNAEFVIGNSIFSLGFVFFACTQASFLYSMQDSVVSLFLFPSSYPCPRMSTSSILVSPHLRPYQIKPRWIGGGQGYLMMVPISLTSQRPLSSLSNTLKDALMFFLISAWASSWAAAIPAIPCFYDECVRWDLWDKTTKRTTGKGGRLSIFCKQEKQTALGDSPRQTSFCQIFSSL